MPIARESFLALLVFERDVTKKYYELKDRVNGLLGALQKVKRMRTDIKKEVDSYLTLIELSTKEMEDGMKKFTVWLCDEIGKLPRISHDTQERLEELRNKIGAINYDETIEELFKIYQASLQETKEE